MTLVVLLWAPAAPSAHQLDEYLGLTHIGILRDRIQLFVSLTPGAHVVDAVLARIDRNRDEQLSIEEQQQYADKIVRRLALAVDDERPTLRLIDATFPSIEGLRTGEGVIQLTLDAAITAQGRGPHSLFFANNNSDELSVYVVSVLKPSGSEIAGIKQERDWFQRRIRVEYDVRTGPLRPSQVALRVGAVASAALLLGLLVILRTRPARDEAA